MNYFISDTHFGGELILARESRPFRSAKEFASAVINNINSQIGVGDVVYHVGDFLNYNDLEKTAFRESICIVRQIKCDSILIIGNNEERIIAQVFGGDFLKFRKFAMDAGFKEVYKESYLIMRSIAIQ